MQNSHFHVLLFFIDIFLSGELVAILLPFSLGTEVFGLLPTLLVVFGRGCC